MLGFFILTFFMLNYYFTDVKITKYTNMQEVKEDQAIQRGWIPTIIPDSAYDISETHDLDKNILFGSFEYQEQD